MSGCSNHLFSPKTGIYFEAHEAEGPMAERCPERAAEEESGWWAGEEVAVFLHLPGGLAPLPH